VVYVCISILLTRNMLMASIPTIPLYKLICNVAYLDVLSNGSLGCKELSAYCSISRCNSIDAFADSYIHNHLHIHQQSTANVTRGAFAGDTPECVAYQHAASSERPSHVRDVADSNVVVHFISRVSNFTSLEFISLQNNIIAYPGDTTLVSSRLYNPTSYNVTCISMYYMFPLVASAHITKLQCLCSELIQVSS
jgi:cytochrome c oxidase assembly protein Cox11